MRKKLWEVKLTAICLSLDQQQPFLHPGCMNVQSYMLKNQLTVQEILDSAIIYIYSHLSLTHNAATA